MGAESCPSLVNQSVRWKGLERRSLRAMVGPRAVAGTLTVRCGLREKSYCPGRYTSIQKVVQKVVPAGEWKLSQEGRQEGSDDLLIPVSNQETPEALGRPTLESARIEGRHIARLLPCSFPVPALMPIDY